MGDLSAQGSSQKIPRQKRPPLLQQNTTQSSIPSTKTSLSPSSQQQITQHNTPQNIPARIQSDMQFLQKSWANLADLQEDEDLDQDVTLQHRNIDLQIAQEIQHNIDESGFQVVTSKSSRKRNNKKLKAVNNTITTRSKVVKSKPV
jgi:hypothetical protein